MRQLDRKGGQRPGKYARKVRARNWLREFAQDEIQYGEGVIERMPEEHAAAVAKFPDRVAAIVGKTFVEKGDEAELADDEAMSMIRDLLHELDPTILERNRHRDRKRLTRSLIRRVG